jgi:UDP-4-amino-4,6-dideoxy-N-acetyl-beta-L-altrosamine N-acetyltransferase
MVDLRQDFRLDKLIARNFVMLSKDEIEFVRNCRNHDEIRKWMYSDDIIPVQDHINFINSLKENNRNYYWLVKMEENYIGVISLNRIDFRNRNAYLGIYTNPFLVSRGKGELLIECIKKLAFDYANLHTLKIEVIDINEKAKNFYNKAGFREEGRLKEFVSRDGKWHDMIVMGITAPEKENDMKDGSETPILS